MNIIFTYQTFLIHNLMNENEKLIEVNDLEKHQDCIVLKMTILREMKFYVN